jgi:hypothetical protein
MIILLDEDGGVVGTIDLDAPADSLLVDGDEFVFEAEMGDDRVYRRRQWGS